MNFFSFEFFEHYVSLEHFSEIERYACAIAGFRKLEAPTYQDADECEYCALQLAKFRNEKSHLNAHAW